MTLTSVGPKSRLRSEVDEFPPKVSLVLRYVLVERRRKSRIVPGGSLCVVVNKVYSGSRGETHFPSGRQRTELRDSLRLNRHVALSGTNDSQELLSTWVDPGGGSSVVIDEIRSSLGCESLFPSSWQRSGSSSSDIVPGNGDIGSATGRSRSTTSLSMRRRLSFQHVVGECTLVMPCSCCAGRVGLGGSVATSTVTRSVPGGRTCVVVNIVLTSKMIDTSFPSLRQRSELVGMRIKLVAGGSTGSSLTSRGSLCGWVDGRCPRAGGGGSIRELRLGDGSRRGRDAWRCVVDKCIDIFSV